MYNYNLETLISTIKESDFKTKVKRNNLNVVSVQIIAGGRFDFGIAIGIFDPVAEMIDIIEFQ